jgi:hypothetical protein
VVRSEIIRHGTLSFASLSPEVAAFGIFGCPLCAVNYDIWEGR